MSTTTMLLINLRPKNFNGVPITEEVSAEQRKQMEEFEIEMSHVSGNFRIPKKFTHIDDEGNLIIHNPDSIWVAIGAEPGEWQIIAEMDVEDPVEETE